MGYTHWEEKQWEVVSATPNRQTEGRPHMFLYMISSYSLLLREITPTDGHKDI